MDRVLVDTNVWLDYHGLRDDEKASVALKAIDTLVKQGSRICVTAGILKDVYYLVGTYLKRQIREEEGSITQELGAAVNEISWGCMNHMLSISEVLAVDTHDCERAVQLRSTHPDFEDNLLLAAAESKEIDLLVTGDRSLRECSPVRSVSPQELLDKAAIL